MSRDRLLVDTTVWVKYLRGTEDALKDKLAPFVLGDSAHVCEIIVMELLRGAKSEKEYSTLLDDFCALPQLEITRAVWERAWHHAYLLRRKGINAPMADVLIASVAVHYGCVLAHSDKHFGMMAGTVGLREEMW